MKLPAGLLLTALTLTARAADKAALVIGCAGYKNITALPLVRTDIKDVGDALTALGFHVTRVPDPGIDAFNEALIQFKTTARGARVALVYYSGHGMEHDTVNYLLPVDCTLETSAQLRSQAINVETLLTDLKATGVPARTVILDCCRDNPFGAATKSWSATKSAVDANLLRELGEAEIPEATMVVFASSSGRKAAARLNKDSTHSPFTAAFLEFMKLPGLSLRDVFDRVEDDVTTATLGRQTPVVKYGGSSKVFREMVLLPGGPLPAKPAADPALLAKLAAMEKKLAELEKEGGNSKAEADRLKSELAAMSVPSRAVPVPEANSKGFTNTLGMKFVPVPGTTVQFCIHETRSKDFAAFIADRNRGYTMNGSDADEWRELKFREVPVGRGAGETAEQSNHPVANVLWLDAVAFCEWLSKKEGKTYRLPTDAEWSLAVGLREGAGTPEKLDGGVKDEYPWGGKFVASGISGNYADTTSSAKFGKDRTFIAGYRDGFATTAPVMSFTANQHGLYDLGGNLWEWVAGCYDGADPGGKNKTLTSSRALRGGSWGDHVPAVLLSSRRIINDPRLRISFVGFRCVVVGSGG